MSVCTECDPRGRTTRSTTLLCSAMLARSCHVWATKGSASVASTTMRPWVGAFSSAVVAPLPLSTTTDALPRSALASAAWRSRTERAWKPIRIPRTRMRWRWTVRARRLCAGPRMPGPRTIPLIPARRRAAKSGLFICLANFPSNMTPHSGPRAAAFRVTVFVGWGARLRPVARANPGPGSASTTAVLAMAASAHAALEGSAALLIARVDRRERTRGGHSIRPADRGSLDLGTPATGRPPVVMALRGGTSVGSRYRCPGVAPRA